jgi:hypothetical protein
MTEAAPLAGWDNFYVIVGSAAGGLTGLTFVVIALIRDVMRGVQPTGLGAFVTPTIVHFCGVLALAAFLSVPHQHLATLSAGLALAGVAGVLYGLRIASHMRNHGSTSVSQYVPAREDWVYNVILPTLAYAVLLVMAGLLWYYQTEALWGVAAATLGLLLIGIRNAWDIAVWTSINRPGGGGTQPPKEG